MAVPPTTAAFCLAAMLAAGGCAGGPGSRALTVVEGSRTTVSLLKFGDGGDGQVFSLQNASSGSAREVYSERSTGAMAKVVPDAQLQALLDVFAEKGLFAGAAASVPAEARAAIVVTQGGQRYGLHGAHADVARKVAFSEAQAYFLAVYQETTAYHSADVDRRDLRAEQDRAQRSGADTVKRHGATGGRRQ